MIRSQALSSVLVVSNSIMISYMDMNLRMRELRRQLTGSETAISRTMDMKDVNEGTHTELCR